MLLVGPIKTLSGRSGQILSNQPNAYIQLGCLVITLVISTFDFLAGWEVSLAFIYAIPISLAAWFSDKITALALALLSVCLSLAWDLLGGLQASDPAIPIVNCAIRLLFYYFLIDVLIRLHLLQSDLEQQV
ncbi:MAG: hypothetical protein ABIQ44_14495, partial [Chloroflexia bacterium]